jgi:hypothetical protein
MDDIWKLLNEKQVPPGDYASGWCYDQLLGAAFAIQQIKCVKLSSNSEVASYRNKIDSLRDLSSNDYDNFALGFYINSSLHRVVWACERLLRFISGKEDERSFKNIIKKLILNILTIITLN